MNDLRPVEARLKDLILNRVRWVVWDVNSFIYIVRPRTHEDTKDIPVGGGNLLSTLGLFSALNYLGKIYYLLSNGFNSKQEEEEWASAKNLVKTIHASKQIKSLITVKSKGQLNETECFKLLMTSWPGNKHLTKTDYEIIWNNFRNKLTHVIDTKEYSASLVYDFSGKNPSEISKLLDKTKDEPFIISDNIVICMTDVLNKVVIIIAEWLCREIDTNKFDTKNMSQALEWLELYG